MPPPPVTKDRASRNLNVKRVATPLKVTEVTTRRKRGWWNNWIDRNNGRMDWREHQVDTSTWDLRNQKKRRISKDQDHKVAGKGRSRRLTKRGESLRPVKASAKNRDRLWRDRAILESRDRWPVGTRIHESVPHQVSHPHRMKSIEEHMMERPTKKTSRSPVVGMSRNWAC